MFIELNEVKQLNANTLSMQEYVESLRDDEPTVILRNYNEPSTPPYMEADVEIFNFEKMPEREEDVAAAFGSKPNIPAANVINAIKAQIGNSGYAMHMSDGSYTGYTIWEVNEFIKNFDNTNLVPYVSETFDCDDFAQCLQGNLNKAFPGIALGTIWYGPKNPPYNWGHAVNIFYSYFNNKVYLIEPQNDAFYTFSQTAWRPWMIVM
jgi:hypothetical protein